MIYLNYRYQTNKNYHNNKRLIEHYNDILAYYRQFPNYVGENYLIRQTPISSLERRSPSSMPMFVDLGPEPFVIDLEDASMVNRNYRQTIWTGKYLQLTLMSIEVGGDIGYEVHEDLDQFIRIEDGEGLLVMGDSMDNLDFQEYVYEDYAFIIPAGKWHNLINTGNEPIKLYSIYAPPAHPHGTVHQTREDAMESEGS